MNVSRPSDLPAFTPHKEAFSIRALIRPIRPTRCIAAAALIAVLLFALTGSASAATSPRWDIAFSAVPSSFAPGDSSGTDTLNVTIANLGGASTDGSLITVTDELPAGLSLDPSGAQAYGTTPLGGDIPFSCTAGSPLTCSGSGAFARGDRIVLTVPVDVAVDASPSLTNTVTVSGGGAPYASSDDLVTVSDTPPSFGFPPGRDGFDASTTNDDGSVDNQAGSHPFAFTTSLNFNQAGTGSLDNSAGGDVRDTHVALPPGLIGNPTAVSQCTTQQFNMPSSPQKGASNDSCPDSSQVGTVLINDLLSVGLYNLVPPPGTPAQLGFNVIGSAVRLTPHLRQGDFGLTLDSLNTPQEIGIASVKVSAWGVPYDPSHDAYRGFCLSSFFGGSTGASCPVNGTPRAFLTLPTSCTGPTTTTIAADSWQSPGAYLPGGDPDLSDPNWKTASFTSHDHQGNPLGIEGCNRLAFAPTVSAQPTTDRASAPTGLDFNLDANNPGLTNPDGLAQSQIKKAVVTLPQGFTINPSAGDGLGTCSPAAYASETVDSKPGTGCPNDSKIGDVAITTPLLDHAVNGSLFIAQQDDPRTTTPGAENPFDSLLAMYVVAKDPATGVLVKVAGKVTPDPVTGQLTTTFDNLPQLPFSHFQLSFRQGQRSPLISPPACGTFTARADLYPWSDPTTPLHDQSSFTITKGFDGGACPSGGVAPFHPQLSAGTYSNAAGAFSPFYVKMTRTDGEQEITSFSSHLPPGLIGRLAGVPFCPDAAIEAAKSKTGTEENQNPSCPAASQVGHTLVGAGVGSVLAYAPGKVYFAGPYHGSPISIAAITSATVGPFDLGTVVVRSAFKIDPQTAQVSVDAAGSDPIPHIVDGIPVHVRDIRVYVDRPNFTLNPTSCNPMSIAATLTGSGADFANPADDPPATVTDPFQVANCALLGFAPKLALKLIGGTKRGQNPKFRAVLTARPGDANIGSAQVTLPHSEFLDNAHIGTVCTRVQFAEGAVPGEKCPAASVYGKAKAITPILSEPLEGPVFLRSSSHQLPDLVAALHNSQVNIALDGHVEGVKGGIRNTFEAVPDAPVTKFTLEMQGGKKGLLENSTNLCSKPHHATADFTGHNGKVYDTKPLLAVQCGKKGKKAHRHRGKK